MKLMAAGEIVLGAVIGEGREREESEREGERWARLLALDPGLHRQLLPSDWRQGVDGLTLSASVRADSTSKLGGATAGEGRERSGSLLVLEVDSGEWGRISLAVKRTAGGLRVVIGARDAAAVEGVLAERAALAGALARIGLNVESVQVVRVDQVGSAISVPTRPPERARARAETAPPSERPGRPAARKLKVFG